MHQTRKKTSTKTVLTNRTIDDRVKKMKNYTTDSKNLHDSVAAGRTNVKEKCAFFCCDLQLAETYFLCDIEHPSRKLTIKKKKKSFTTAIS